MKNKKIVDKANTDIKKLKAIVSEIQINVSEHNYKINQEMVDEQKLQINFELQEAQLE